MPATTHSRTNYMSARDMHAKNSEDLALFVALAQGQSPAVVRTDAAVIAVLAEVASVDGNRVREIQKVDGILRRCGDHALITGVAVIAGCLAPISPYLTNDSAGVAMMKAFAKMTAATLSALGH